MRAPRSEFGKKPAASCGQVTALKLILKSLGARRGESGAPEIKCGAGFSHVMHAQDLHPLCHTAQGHGERAGDTVSSNRRAADLADKALARGPKENGTAEAVKEREVLQEG